MSEHDEDRPLTRRERRLREMAETGALDLSEALAQAKEPVVPAEGLAAPVAAPEGVDVEEEISAFHPDGTPRSRREMRELREAAQARVENLAPTAAEPVPTPESSSDAEPTATSQPSGVEVTSPATEDVILGKMLGSHASGDPADSEAPLDFDSLMSPPTEPFSIEEMREAERNVADLGLESVDGEGVALLVEPDAAVDSSASLLEEFELATSNEVVAESELVEPELTEQVAPDQGTVATELNEGSAPEEAKSKRRFPWSRNKSADVADEVTAESAVTEQTATENEDFAEDAASSAEQETSSVESSVETPLVAEELVATETRDQAAPVTEKYSFPDIVPPEEWRSVFDDPASRRVGTQPGAASGDFDDLISRAVAQEGAAAATNTSALILPGTPEDTDGLSGPLGATGELYITGSIELPRSLGETGGHASLHDSLQFEPFTLPETPEPAVSQHDTLAPVSAKSAVSARVPSGVPVVAKPTKEHSKLPLILGLSGGGLLIVIVGLGVWGVTSGLFSG